MNERSGKRQIVSHLDMSLSQDMFFYNIQQLQTAAESQGVCLRPESQGVCLRPVLTVKTAPVRQQQPPLTDAVVHSPSRVKTL